MKLEKSIELYNKGQHNLVGAVNSPVRAFKSVGGVPVFIDHAKGSNLVSDACFLSGLLKIETQLDGEKQNHWRPKQVYHYMQWKNLEPDIAVDVSGYMDTKMKAVLAYQTQFYDPNSEEPETPISSKNFTDSVKYRARDLGRLIGTEYAEGFSVERYAAVSSLFDLI